MAAVWTQDEIATLRGMLAANTSTVLIARKLRRSPEAVIQRARRLESGR
jgi:hypothetical protein